MNIVFLGKPGAGKGTQAGLLSLKFKIPHLSMGALLRQAYREGTSEGIEAEEYWGKGLNAPSALKFKILERKLKECQKGFILDNFPRTKNDLKVLKRYLKASGKKIDRVFHLKVRDSQALKRLLARAEEDKKKGVLRKDETRELIRIRIEKGYRKEAPFILDYFQKQGVLVEIEAEKTIEELNEEILSHLVRNNRINH